MNNSNKGMATPSVRQLPMPRPPGPHELPIVGQSLRYLREPIKLMQDTASYGDLATMSVRPWLVYLLNHPDLIEEVLVTNHQRVGRWRNVEAFKYLMGEGTGYIRRPIASQAASNYAAQISPQHD